ncbi:(Fe-S)-binding protein [Thiolapillus brandeum]|uniref:(Fe-S)-binding protein n=1 Tax=Thiolapillus brandeum TaxID=1076588 RepID=UPI0009E3C9C3|nr:(Fe-S)-binding protein [Thiolapillus brandeum]
MIFEAAQCVKCGLCLAQCPTYGLTASEAQSPRGRIALIQALDRGQLQGDRHTADLLDSCLLCRRCEKVCPSGVPFAALMDKGRAMVRPSLPVQEKWLAAILSRPWLSRVLVASGKLLPKGASLGRFAAQASLRTLGLKPHYFPKGKKAAGRVGLFAGCTSALLDREAVQAALALLLQAGFEVVVPVAQQCCGALDAHAGNAGRAARLMKANESAFRDAGPLDAIVSIATGCGAQLHDYESLPAPHEDICSFLARREVLEKLRFRALDASMAVHLPCSLVNVLQHEQAVLRLLERIPGLRAAEVGRRGACCGAAGTAVLLRPRVAEHLRTPLVEEIAVFSPDGVLSGNVSCRMHLAAGDDQAGRAYLHPLVLLAQQLIRE